MSICPSNRDALQDMQMVASVAELKQELVCWPVILSLMNVQTRPDVRL